MSLPDRHRCYAALPSGRIYEVGRLACYGFSLDEPHSRILSRKEVRERRVRGTSPDSPLSVLASFWFLSFSGEQPWDAEKICSMGREKCSAIDLSVGPFLSGANPESPVIGLVCTCH